MLNLSVVEKENFAVVKIDGDNFTPVESSEKIAAIVPQLIGRGVILDGRCPVWLALKFGAVLGNKCKFVAQLSAPTGKVIVAVAVGDPSMADREIPYNPNTMELG